MLDVLPWLAILREQHDFLQEKMQGYAKLLSNADRMLETEIIDGRECIGFEIRYNKNPVGNGRRFNRIWIDVETKLPARIERHGLPVTTRGTTITLIHDQFEYYAEVPIDLFTAEIPEGFVNAHPDDVRRQRMKSTNVN